MFRFHDAMRLDRSVPRRPRINTKAPATVRAGSTLRPSLRRISPRLGVWRGAVSLGIALFLVLSSPALAALEYWTGGGPLESDVTAVAIHPLNPDIVYVSRGPVIYRSLDDGLSWTYLGFYLGEATMLRIDPVQPRRIYAVVGGRLYRTENSALTWRLLFSAAPPNDLVIDSRDPAVLYLAGRSYDDHLGTHITHVRKSVDYGDSWLQVAEETEGREYLSLAIDPLDSSVVYVATDRGLWKSVDAGATWHAVTPAGSVGSDAPGVTAAVAVDPAVSGVLYYAAVDGFFKSLDGGDTWIEAQGAPRTFHDLVIDPQDTASLFGATDDGVYRSLDAGATWQRVCRRASCTTVHGVALDPIDPRKVWLSSLGEGLVRSLDGGESWSVLQVAEDDRWAEVLSLLALPGPPTTLFAATATSGVYRSLDAGRHWERRNRRLERPRIHVLLPPGGGSGLLAGTDRGLFRTTDGGQHWEPWGAGGLQDRAVLSLARDPQLPPYLYAGTDAGVFRSRDGGATWNRSPIPSAIDSAAVESLAVNRHRGLEIWAAVGADGLFRSRDGGTTWTRVRFFGERTESVLVDPGISSRVYVGADDGLYRTTDAGSTWEQMTDGLCTTSCPAVHQLVSTYGTIVWACTERGAYSSRDRGVHWELFDVEGESHPCRVLAPHPWSPATLFVGRGRGGGVYDRQAIGCSRPDELCLGSGPGNHERFRVELTRIDLDGHRDVAGLRPHTTADSGVFWFFEPQNWELLVKVINGSAYDGHHWVFAGATSNLEFGLRVTDRYTDHARLYYNPKGQTPITLTEIGVFPDLPGYSGEYGAVVEEAVTLPPSPPPQRSLGFDPTAVGEPCVPSATEHCFLDGRFRVGVTWRDFDGHQGVGRTEPYPSDDSGLMWFFDPQNHELLLKMVDGCGYNGRFWVFAAATTNVEYDLVVTDTGNGATVTYHNPLGQPAATVTDIEAFDGCP